MGSLLLLPDQRRAWVAYDVLAEPAAQHVVLAYDIRGPLDAKRLEDACRRVVARHEALRARPVDADEAHVVLEADVPFALTVEEGAADPSSWRDEVTARRIGLVHGFHTAILRRFAEDHHGLVWILHRAIACAASVETLHRSLEAALRGTDEGEATPGLSAFLADSEARRASSLAAVTEAAAARLAGELPSLDLPLDHHRPALFSGRGRTLHRVLEPARVASLRATAEGLGVDVDAVLTTAFAAVLARYGNASELVFGHASAPDVEAGRITPGAPLSVLRAEIEPTTTVRAMARHLASAIATARGEDVLSFQELVDRLAPPRDPSRAPLVQASIELEPPRGEGFAIDGLRFERVDVARTGAGTDLTLHVRERGEGLELALEYATDLFEEANARRMLDGCVVALDGLADALDAPFATLEVLTEAERARATSVRNIVPYDAMRPSFVRFEENAARTPERVAAVFGTESLTYDGLARRCRKLARRLVREGVGAETLVGIYCERSLDMLVAVIAVEMAGGAYVPLDPAHPSSRIQTILEDAAPRIVLTQRAIHERCPEVPGCLRLDVDDPGVDGESDAPLERPIDPDQLAYVIFTSGSTGRPKGVEVTHRAFTNFLASMAKEPGMREDDRILSVTTLSFDIAGLELQLPLFVGASVEIVDRETTLDATKLAARLADPTITMLQATPATFRLLVESGWHGSPRLRVLCGGEAFPLDLLRALLPRTGEVWNVYGPTETTVWSTARRLVDDSTPISIGGPIDNTSLVLLSKGGALAPWGCVGEIWIGGDGVARGYRERPELTADRFRPDPWAGTPGARMYGTGDLGRFLPDGSLVCLGRVDFQVKIRGFRIEPGDIESALVDEPEVRQAVVVAREDTPGDRRLVAYLVLESSEEGALDRVREVLRAKLPAYMVPAAFVVLDALPLNPSGKIDRKALPAPTDAPRADRRAGRPPADDAEAAIAAVFREVLGTHEVDVDASFFDLGGNSLLAATLVRRLSQTLGRPVPLATLFDAPSVAALARFSPADASAAEKPRVIPLRLGKGDTALFCVVGVALYQALADAMPDEVSVYGCFVPAEAALVDHANLDRGRLVFPSVEELAAQYVSAIRAVKPSGPYHIAGVSFGGVIAYAVAAQLRKEGHEVPTVALLDALLPSDLLRHPDRWAAERLMPFVRLRAQREAFRKLVLGRLGRPPRSFDEAEIVCLRDFAYDQAAAAFKRRLPVFDGRVLVVGALDRSEFQHRPLDPTSGFREVIRGPIRRIDVEGSHLGILVEPGVREIARALLETVLPARG